MAPQPMGGIEEGGQGKAIGLSVRRSIQGAHREGCVYVGGDSVLFATIIHYCWEMRSSGEGTDDDDGFFLVLVLSLPL